MEIRKRNPQARARNRGSIDGFIYPSSKTPDNRTDAPSNPYPPISPRRNRPEPEEISWPEKPRVQSQNQQDSLINKNIASGFYNQPDKQPVKKAKHHRSKKKIAVLAIVLLIVGAIGVGLWDAWQLYHKINHLNVGNLTASVGGTENILVAGSTNRCNLKVQNSEWGFCSQGVTGVNSDIIFIVHLDPAKRTVSVLSIPRDTFIPDARSGNQPYKIDAALYEGPTQLVKAVEQDFGIPIQHYVEVGFDGFVNIVNAVGGIKMNFPMPVYDSESYLNVEQPGCYELNGVQALQVVRARHLQYKPATITTDDHNYWPQETVSDIGRIARTHEFLRVLATTVAAKGVGNPITDQKLIDAIAPQVQVDSGFSTSAMLQLAEEFHSVNVNNVPQFTLPIVTTGFGSYIYDGNNYGDVVFPYENNDEQIIQQFLGESSSVNTYNGNPLPSASSINVNVINGSGVTGQADVVSNDLQKLDFNIVGQPTSINPASTQATETVVYYANPSMIGDALAVLNKLSGFAVLSENSSMVTDGSDVTVVTGTGLSVNGVPSTTSSTTTIQAKSSTSSSSSSKSSSTTTTTSLGPVSSATQPLSAWDPTACSPGQKAITDSKI